MPPGGVEHTKKPKLAWDNPQAPLSLEQIYTAWRAHRLFAEINVSRLPFRPRLILGGQQ